ncbi:MBL fold metallo-hydrolase [Gymnodinialimonas sp. 2305UL16-5]|uniref:MBL fold metallo-hydrolase n=1 Tax=Gymnodinialimonas mytili TaxID=3126503 RepID=UPI00309ED4F0
MPNRRQVLMQLTAATAASGTVLMPYRLRADGHSGDVFDTTVGQVTVHPISHASMVLQVPAGTIYVDPVGGAALYDGLPEPDLILITHEHADHYDPPTLAALVGSETQIIANPAVQAQLDHPATVLANGESVLWEGAGILAIPAHNLTEGRLQFHPPGRDNGYVIDLGGYRIYISGDTEDVPEMRALQGIDLAFVCMNLPFTMDAEAAADAVREFAPRVVYPYHYRGRDNGTQDPAEFAEMVGDASEVRLGPWYS